MSIAPLPWMPAAAHGGAFTAGNPDFVVIHCTESDNGPGTAESLAGPNWFGGSAAGTSAHRIFDRNSGVEMVRRTTVAYHAGPKGNTYGRAYEFCGRASWTAAQWRAPEQLAMLRLAAPYIADDLREIAATHGVNPLAIVRWLSVVQVAQTQPGLCTHNDIRLAFPGTTAHSDPGPNFPYAELLSYIRAELTGTPIEEDFPMFSQWSVEEKNAFGEWLIAWVLPRVAPVYAQAVLQREFPKRGPGATGKTSLEQEVAWLPTNLASIAAAASGGTDVAALRSVLVQAVQEGMAAGQGATAEQIVDALAARLAS